jgi:hypothetical protein
MYVEVMENGNILLKAGRMLGNQANAGKITQVSLPRIGDTFLWFDSFLTGIENRSEHKTDGRQYQAERNAEGLFLQDVRDGGFSSIVGYTLDEVPAVLEEFRQCVRLGN